VVKKRGDDIIFIKKIVRGGTGDSFGIEVAKLAGLPEEVIRRAKAVLKDTESRQAQVLPGILPPQDEPEEPESDQLSLAGFAREEIMEQLKTLEPDTLSPIEALGLLYQLSKKAKES
jgi:Mismatch repair ATPase (MutS family)